MSTLYYTAPSDEQFAEVKKAAMQLWPEIDSEFGYATEKVNRIKDIQNVQDNFMYIVAMFDIDNQRKLANKLSAETREQIRLRLVDGGQPSGYIVF